MTQILYKYRSLQNFKSLVDILLRSRLYAAQYKDLNDPMEGQYYYRSGELDKNTRTKLLENKKELRLCALSKVRDNELMWSHYADGHKGVAIGVRIDESVYTVKPIQYDGLALIRKQDFNDQTATEILCRKLSIWSYEEEVRVFVRYKKFIHVKIEEVITGRAMSNSDFGLIKDLLSKIDPGIRIIKADSIM